MITDPITRLLQAEQALESANKALETIEVTDEDDLPQSLRKLQLVLQFRLDTQNALSQLFRCQQSLSQILGVSSQQGEGLNLERLAFALGHEALHHALSRLTLLIDMVLRLVHQLNYRKTQAEARVLRQTMVKRQAKKSAKTVAFEAKLALAITNQKTACLLLKELTDSCEAMAGQPVEGPVLEFAGKIQGPISRFYQALQSGFILSGGLYQQLEQRIQPDLKLNQLMLQLEQALPKTVPHAVYTPVLFNPSNSLAPLPNLEARAATKRLSPFFQH